MVAVLPVISMAMLSVVLLVLGRVLIIPKSIVLPAEAGDALFVASVMAPERFGLMINIGVNSRCGDK